jgi:sugar phosphate isomerase/epimerase
MMTTTRRSFLGAVAGGIGAGMAFPRSGFADEARPAPFGLQLWSLRGQLEKDLPGTLARIKSWGIDEVESAGFYGRTAAEFGAELKKAGLRCQAMHIRWDQLDKDMAGVLRDAEAVGAGYVLNASLPHKTKPHATREEILRAASAFAKWGQEAKAAGRRFAYHLHSQEFGPAPEGTLFDVLAKESGPDVGFEVDVFWVTWGGGDPVKLMEKYPGRVWFTHLKDMAKGVVPGKEGQDLDAANVVVGTGGIDVAGVVRAGKKAGVVVHYIEDESRDPAGQIPKSLAYLRGLAG